MPVLCPSLCPASSMHCHSTRPGTFKSTDMLMVLQILPGSRYLGVWDFADGASNRSCAICQFQPDQHHHHDHAQPSARAGANLLRCQSPIPFLDVAFPTSVSLSPSPHTHHCFPVPPPPLFPGSTSPILVPKSPLPHFCSEVFTLVPKPQICPQAPNLFPSPKFVSKPQDCSQVPRLFPSPFSPNLPPPKDPGPYFHLCHIQMELATLSFIHPLPHL